jgi:hypothetical protein
VEPGEALSVLCQCVCRESVFSRRGDASTLNLVFKKIL